MKKNSNPENDISLTVTITQNDFFENLINISNSYVKLIRVVSFLYRFIRNCRTRSANVKGSLTSQKVSYAENWLIRSLHEKEFPEEMGKLLAGEPIPIRKMQQQLTSMLNRNCINGDHPQLSSTTETIYEFSNSETKTLGVTWGPTGDCFCCPLHRMVRDVLRHGPGPRLVLYSA
ncbi:hypothetical protein NPIL_366661 [Nephila pilipes]|uniref:Uncharacterized protein n=1 Tax=Nephila pilipes TaxID=299642 RepID=A0A8X6MD03_NEPPI|nr:hypothetical protein NPIL_366661 [Nephila pilipes]